MVPMGNVGRMTMRKHYRYRNLPCNIVPDKRLWCVVGIDTETGGGGILEWCYDARDAEGLFHLMRQDHGRFVNLAIRPWEDDDA